MKGMVMAGIVSCTKPDNSVKYSFCIITDGKEPDKLRKLIESIDNQMIKEGYEIIVAGNWYEDENADIYIEMKGAAHHGNLGMMRNAACLASCGDVLIVLDDDMVMHNGFYEGLRKYGDDFDVLSCKIHNPDGTRFWDWKGYRNGANWLLEYNETSPYVSLTGGLTIMKASVFDAVQWADDRGFYQNEDVDFTNRLKDKGFRIEFNEHSTVTHNANYTQIGNGVFVKD